MVKTESWWQNILNDPHFKESLSRWSPPSFSGLQERSETTLRRLLLGPRLPLHPVLGTRPGDAHNAQADVDRSPYKEDRVCLAASPHAKKPFKDRTCLWEERELAFCPLGQKMCQITFKLWRKGKGVGEKCLDRGLARTEEAERVPLGPQLPRGTEGGREEGIPGERQLQVPPAGQADMVSKSLMRSCTKVKPLKSIMPCVLSKSRQGKAAQPANQS